MLRQALQWTFAGLMLLVLAGGVRNVVFSDDELRRVTSASACGGAQPCQPKLASLKRGPFSAEYVWRVGKQSRVVSCARQWWLVGDWRCEHR